jgi:hypothetical protein
MGRCSTGPIAARDGFRDIDPGRRLGSGGRPDDGFGAAGFGNVGRWDVDGGRGGLPCPAVVAGWFPNDGGLSILPDVMGISYVLVKQFPIVSLSWRS